MKLLAVALAVWAANHPLKLVTQAGPGYQLHATHTPPVPRMTPQQNEWFARAIDHILRGD